MLTWIYSSHYLKFKTHYKQQTHRTGYEGCIVSVWSAENFFIWFLPCWNICCSSKLKGLLLNSHHRGWLRSYIIFSWTLQAIIPLAMLVLLLSKSWSPNVKKLCFLLTLSKMIQKVLLKNKIDCVLWKQLRINAMYTNAHILRVLLALCHEEMIFQHILLKVIDSILVETILFFFSLIAESLRNWFLGEGWGGESLSLLPMYSNHIQLKPWK